ASNNVMPIKVANSLGLTLTRASGLCYSMESKEVPLVGKINDAQVDLPEFPDKKVSMNIL
ncbi:hypothetical protein KI387_031443, partial [Taxus chinensis]